MIMHSTSTPAGPARTPAAADLERYRVSLRDEVDSAFLYRAVAEADPAAAAVYLRLAEVEERHAAFWEERLREAGAPVPPRRPGRRARVLAWLARRFGPGAVLPSMLAAERSHGPDYGAQPEVAGTSMAADERQHARILSAVSGGMEGGTLARLEGRHRAIGGNALRAAVLGANDGLVSSLSLVMGVAGAALDERSILITGVAGLLAGAGSMAMGEWLSVQSSRELYQRQIAVEREEIERAPQEEAEELALIYQAKGLPEDQARALAGRLMADPATALDTLSREELGIDPKELGGSAVEAAVTSFVLFALGAAVPVLPFAFLSGMTAVATSVGVSALALFLVGAGITLLTGRSVLFSGTRQLAIGLAAAGLTFAAGRLIGVNLGG
jgi:VIT1/CCC1 family predicted Fe2+/Mn2+ transporter